MKKSLIFLMALLLVGCATVQDTTIGFSYVEKATELTAFEYLAMSDIEQKAIANGFLIGMACVADVDINALDLTKRTKYIAKTDHRVLKDTILYFVLWEALKQIVEERTNQNA